MGRGRGKPVDGNMRCPQEKMYYSVTVMHTVAGVSGAQKGTSAAQDDGGMSPDQYCDDPPVETTVSLTASPVLKLSNLKLISSCVQFDFNNI